MPGVVLRAPSDITRNQINGEHRSEFEHELADPTLPLIAHIPGRGRQVVIMLCPSAPLSLGRRGTEIDDPLPTDAFVEARLNACDAVSSALVGRDVLSTWAPMALAVKLARDLAEQSQKEALPGHVLIVFAPQALTGGTLFERAGTYVNDILRRLHLHPVAALVPGQSRLGAGRRNEAKSHRHVVLTGGNHGVLTLQLTACGVPAGPETALAGFDAIGLLAGVLTDIRTNEAFHTPRGRAPLPPPVITGLTSGTPHATGHMPSWVSGELHVPYLDAEPEKLIAQIKDIAFDSFAKQLSAAGLNFDRFHRAAGITANGGLSWRPAVVTFSELRQLATADLPPVRLPRNQSRVSMPWAYETARRRTLAAYESSPLAGRPLLAIGIVPPTHPPQGLPDGDAVRDVLRDHVKRVGGAFTRAGGHFGAFHRLTIGAAPSRLTRPLLDEHILPAELGGIGMSTTWMPMRVIGFGPVGLDHGMHSERVLVEPTFTKLPTLLRGVVPALLSLNDAPLNLALPSFALAQKVRNPLDALKRKFFKRNADTVEEAEEMLATPDTTPAAQHDEDD